MRKIIPYISILVILTGLFSPMVTVRAQPALGACILLSNNKPIPSPSRNDCLLLNVATTIVRWDPTAPQAPLKGDNEHWAWVQAIIDIPETAIKVLGSLVVGPLLSMAIGLAAWLTNLALSLNNDLINAPVVQTGFGISLAFANLGFVLAIIVIAIATILRIESYGIKQILWKLIVMAFLVNFGLVIAGVILNFADQTAFALYSQASPDKNIAGFTDALKSGFQDQTLWQPPDVAQLGGGALDEFSKTVMDVVLRSAFLVVIALTFFGLAVMLIIRFVYIGVLLVLLPLAWLLWVFPNTQQYFSQWWQKFLQQTFFLPLVIFFLYLALITVTGSGGTTQFVNQKAAQSRQPSSVVPGTAVGMVAASTGRQGQENRLSASFAQMAILSALALGGLFAANSLGVMGASAAMGAGRALTKGATGAMKGGGGWAMRKGSGLAIRGVGGAGRAIGNAAARGAPAPYTGWGSRLINPLKQFNYKYGLGGGVRGAVKGAKTLAQTKAGQMAVKAGNYVATSRAGQAVGTAVSGAAAGAVAGANRFATKMKNSPGLLRSVAAGSGLYKGKQVKHWECQVCNNIVPGTKKPVFACPICHSLAPSANWRQV